MYVVPVLDVLLVHIVRLHAVGAVPTREELDEACLELRAEIGDVPTGVLADGKHLAKMALRLGMALEAVLVAALFLADLAVPPQTLKSLGLHRIREVLRRSNCR